MIEWRGYRAALDQDFALECDTIFGPLESTWVVTQGLRSKDAQASLYALYQKGGPLAAPPGHSPHEWGLAIDVALLKFDGSLSWDTSFPAWPELWAAIQGSPGLHSGHNFPPIAPADDDHVEAYRWAYTMDGKPSKRAQLEAAGQW